MPKVKLPIFDTNTRTHAHLEMFPRWLVEGFGGGRCLLPGRGHCVRLRVRPEAVPYGDSHAHRQGAFYNHGRNSSGDSTHEFSSREAPKRRINR